MGWKHVLTRWPDDYQSLMRKDSLVDVPIDSNRVFRNERISFLLTSVAVFGWGKKTGRTRQVLVTFTSFHLIYLVPSDTVSQSFADGIVWVSVLGSHSLQTLLTRTEKGTSGDDEDQVVRAAYAEENTILHMKCSSPRYDAAFIRISYINS